MDGRFKVLVTGAEGFTGRYLQRELSKHGYECIGLKSDLLNKDAVLSEVVTVSPNYVIHLASISFTAEVDTNKIYNVNVVGSMNLLEALSQLKEPPDNVILASTAAVYGAAGKAVLDEEMAPAPVSHYACSKLCMEHMSKNYADLFPITIVRPFNYTGPGHGENFLIPKIVKAYKAGQTQIELGNLDVSREFNDVRDVCTIYRIIMSASPTLGVINICTGRSISLLRIIEIMDSVAGVKMRFKVNPMFVRDNEITNLSGNPSKLLAATGYKALYSIEDTLSWMYS
ncbi:MAG TPA: epimerase [Halieaceae bacterium]|nr:epimerase [Halieaceae bacterium]